MRFPSVCLALLIVQPAAAFLTTPRINNHVKQHGLLLSATVTDTDVSVPYDAAARLAYDEWCQKYNKPQDSKRYVFFKKNYETITVANVAAKKQARETGQEQAAILTLNEYGDFSEEEYKAMMRGEKPKTISTEGVLDKAVKAAEAQSAASGALQEAADALADEEEVRRLLLWSSFASWMFFSSGWDRCRRVSLVIVDSSGSSLVLV